MAQNAVEKITLQHLFQCIVHDLGPQEAAESGSAKGLVGVDKEIMKYGLVNRKAKTAYKKDERFLIVVPGKLLLFKGMDIVGKHLVYGQLEFEVIVPDSKSLNLLTLSAEELTGWIGAIEKSSLFANEGPGDSGNKNLENSRAERRDPAYRNQEDPGDVGRRKSEPSSRDTKIDNFDASTQQGSYMSRSKESMDPESVARRMSEPSSRDTRRDNFGATSQGLYTNRLKVPEGRVLRRGSNRLKGERGYIDSVQDRERDQRNQVPGEHAGYRVKSRGFRESLNHRNDRIVVDSSNRFGQTSIQPPRRSLEQGRERDQPLYLNNSGQNDQRFEGFYNCQEPSETSNQLTKPLRSPRKGNPDQRDVENFHIYSSYCHGEDGKRAGLESREGCDLGENKESLGIFERYEERSAGKQLVSYAQSGCDGGNAEYLPGSIRGHWEGSCGPSVESGNADEKSSMNKVQHRSTIHSSSLSAELNHQLPPQASLRNRMDSSKDEQQQMFFYLDMYRRGLIDSSSQTK